MANQYTYTNIVSKYSLLSQLVREKQLTDPYALQKFYQQTGLADLYWQVVYYEPPGESLTLPEALKTVDGYVFFLHGWDGSHRIWEDLPMLLALKNRSVVCFSLDVNGFGRSPFLSDLPKPEHCSPAALMAAIERWITTLDLWPSPPNRERNPFYLFVGHSMGGAALFYKNEVGWHNDAYGLYALAPALLCNDTQRQTFYKTLGMGIRFPSFATVKNMLAPRVIDVLAAGSSAAVKEEHLNVFSQTPFGTLAQTFYVMGATSTKPQRTDIGRFQITLGHKDRLVGLNFMLDLLDELDFRPEQIHLALGDHYFFSYDRTSPNSHKYNRQMVLDDLVAFCARLSREVH